MELLLIGAAVVGALTAAVLVLLVRSVRALRRTDELLSAAGVPTGAGSPYRDAVTAGRSLGTRVSVVMVLLTIAAWVVTTAVTAASEPEAVSWLVSLPMVVIALPTVVVLLVLTGVWVNVGAVREVHRWLRSADLAPDDEASEHAEPIEQAGPVEQVERARAEALRVLRRITWSQVGVTGVGVAAGTLSVVFGVLLVGALFALASTAIACTRNPKCI